MDIKGHQDGRGLKVGVLFGVFSPKRKEKGSHMMYVGMLCAEEMSLSCVAAERKPQAHKEMFKVAHLA